MLVVFYSKPAAEVLMFAEHALLVLKAAGKPYTDTLPERGVITHEQLDDAIAGIEKAIIEGPPIDERLESDDDNDDRAHPISQPVNFRQRSFPLLAMLRLAKQHNADVTWEPAPSW